MVKFKIISGDMQIDILGFVLLIYYLYRYTKLEKKTFIIKIITN